MTPHPMYPSMTPEMLANGRERYRREYRRDRQQAFPCWGPSAVEGQERLDRWLERRRQRRHRRP